MVSTNGWNLLSTFLCFEAMALLCSSPIVLAATWGITRHTVLAFAGVFAVTLPICLLLAWSHNRYVRKRGGFVELEDDRLYYFENENDPPVYAAPLDRCLWFEGCRTWATLPRQDKFLQFQITVGPQVLILQFPEWLCVPEYRVGKAIIAEQPVIVAVGQTPETREQWLTAFESMGVVCDTTRHQRRLAPISGGLSAFWFLFCLGSLFITMMYVGKETIKLLNHWNVPGDVAEAIGFSLFMPGVIFLLFWIGLFPILWINRLTGIGKSKATWYQPVMGAVAILVFILGAAWSMANKTFDWKIAYTVSTVVMCVVTFVCYWLLVRPPKRKESE